jgi:hypothetical protein
MKKRKKVTFHGAFATKTKAKKKERRVKGAFIRKVTIKRRTRYLVMTRRKR